PELRRLDEPTPPSAPVAPDTPEVVEAPDAPAASPERHYRGEVVRIGGSALLPADQSAREVIAIFGDVIADGEVRGDAVAVLGNVTINHSSRDAIAVMGNVTINGVVRGEVVAVMGSVQLGPNARVEGDIVTIGGQVDRAPGAQAMGEVHQVGPLPAFGSGFPGLRTWFEKCFVLGRPLAFDRQVLWAWTIAGIFVVMYLLIALLFTRPIVACAETMETRPGRTLGVAVLLAIGTPILVLLLLIVGVGLLLIPILMIAGLFGKAAFLAWLGRRLTLPLGQPGAVLAVLVGSVVLLLLYTVPVLGFVMMNVSGVLGFGMAVYTMVLSARRPALVPAPLAPGGPTTPVPAAPTSSASAGFAVPPPVAAPVAPPPMPTPSVPPPTPMAAHVGEPPRVSSGFSSDPVPPPSSVLPPSPPPVPPPPPPPAAPAPAMGASVPPPVPDNLQLLTLPRASFWLRLAASLLDAVLVVVVINLLGLGRYLPLLYAAYCVVLWSLKGTTIGGIICGLKIVRLDGRRLDWTVALVRALGGFLSLAVAGLGFVWVAFDPERQSWHDKVAGTTIVRVPKGVSLV
ncbi:MAG TPA: RDD family protein, partial [Candidatus Synoicihabitans sp.]|nr:RDD family protein [Candidatus Synoicihabitans sp.]